MHSFAPECPCSPECPAALSALQLTWIACSLEGDGLRLVPALEVDPAQPVDAFKHGGAEDVVVGHEVVLLRVWVRTLMDSKREAASSQSPLKYFSRASFQVLQKLKLNIFWQFFSWWLRGSTFSMGSLLMRASISLRLVQRELRLYLRRKLRSWEVRRCLSRMRVWYFSGWISGSSVKSQVYSHPASPLPSRTQSILRRQLGSWSSRMSQISSERTLLRPQRPAKRQRFLAYWTSQPRHLTSSLRLLPMDPEKPSPMWKPAWRTNCSKVSSRRSLGESSMRALLRRCRAMLTCRQVRRASWISFCVSIVFPRFLSGLLAVKYLVVSNSMFRSSGVFQKPRKKGQSFSMMVPPLRMTMPCTSAAMVLMQVRVSSRAASISSKLASLRYMKMPWTFWLSMRRRLLVGEASSILVSMSWEPCSPAPITSRLVIFQMAFSRMLVSMSLRARGCSSCSLTSLRASKGLVEILLMETHMLSRGMRAWMSIEYMKMIVEKISSSVMKQLRTMLMNELTRITSRLLNTTRNPSPYDTIFSVSMQSLSGAYGCVMFGKSSGQTQVLLAISARRYMTGADISKEERMKRARKACVRAGQEVLAATAMQLAAIWSRVGSLLYQVSAEMRGRMMMRLMMRRMMFCWMRSLRDSPSLKFSLLLLIFSRDSFFWRCSFSSSSCQRRSSSMASSGSTLMRCSGSSLNVCSSRSTMLVISNVFRADAPGAWLFSMLLAILERLRPRRRKFDALTFDFPVRFVFSVAASSESLLCSEMRSSEMGSRRLASSTFLGSSWTSSVLFSSSSSLSDLSLLSMAVSVLSCDSPLTESAFLASCAFCSSSLCLVLKQLMKMRSILAARPPMRERRLALTTLAMVRTAGRLLLRASQLSTQVISITIDTVDTRSIQKQNESRYPSRISPFITIYSANTQMNTMCTYPKMQAVGWPASDFTKSIAKMLQMVTTAIRKLQTSLLAIRRSIQLRLPVPRGSPPTLPLPSAPPPTPTANQSTAVVAAVPMLAPSIQCRPAIIVRAKMGMEGGGGRGRREEGMHMQVGGSVWWQNILLSIQDLANRSDVFFQVVKVELQVISRIRSRYLAMTIFPSISIFDLKTFFTKYVDWQNFLMKALSYAFFRRILNVSMEGLALQKSRISSTSFPAKRWILTPFFKWLAVSLCSRLQMLRVSSRSPRSTFARRYIDYTEMSISRFTRSPGATGLREAGSAGAGAWWERWEKPSAGARVQSRAQSSLRLMSVPMSAFSSWEQWWWCGESSQSLMRGSWESSWRRQQLESGAGEPPNRSSSQQNQPKRLDIGYIYRVEQWQIYSFNPGIKFTQLLFAMPNHLSHSRSAHPPRFGLIVWEWRR